MSLLMVRLNSRLCICDNISRFPVLENSFAIGKYYWVGQNIHSVSDYIDQ